ncbi:MAG: hypothetical protein HY300_19590 [Verrucomicrobia bacterium]|nr:hypothetical protein [Verrucomicrobiota bacterium]
MRGWFFSLVLGGMLLGFDAAAMPLRQSLAMFESGATGWARSEADLKRGGHGEVSRFQILPEVWRQYSHSTDYDNPEVAWAVTQRIIADRTKHFREATGHEPNALELYLLWNKPGSFEAAGYVPTKVKSVYRQRAQRFANLHDGR